MTDARDFFGYKHPDEVPGREPDGEDGPDPDAPPRFDEAVTLDAPAVVARIDREDMMGRVRGLPRQLAGARQAATGLNLTDRHRDVDLVVVLGMGGSAIGADLVAAAAGDRLRVPLIVQRDYHLPAGLGQRTLVVASSHSGETIETVTAAAEARERGLPLVVIASGGSLGRQAEADGTPFLRYDQPGQPRAAVGWSVGLLHELLGAAGLLTDPDPLGPVVAILDEVLERLGPGVETDANPAKQLGVEHSRPHPGRVRGRAPWRRSHAAGRPSSTRTPSRGRPGNRCPRPTTTPSKARSTLASRPTPRS